MALNKAKDGRRRLTRYLRRRVPALAALHKSPPDQLRVSVQIESRHRTPRTSISLISRNGAEQTTRRHMRLLQRVRTAEAVRGPRTEPRAGGVRVQAHPGVVRRAGGRGQAPASAAFAVLDLPVDVGRPVPGDAVVRQRLQLGVEPHAALPHPEAQEVASLN
ncbi:hypothetical protein EVAR_7107_1 [Eumeta japonica]|uniref:Uncharacterized protein n=1 Tax=Eumeta variegata TaxID=151549 RepID=A0A4C2A5A6_EUMVA|nr:hypothetical protein EVAR_7107_1 [Eumeta japonica]